MEFQLCTEQGVKERELIPGISGRTNEDGDLLLQSVVLQLRERGYMLFGAVLSYYSQLLDGYVFCAVDPVPPSVYVPACEVVAGKLVLRGKVDAGMSVEKAEVVGEKKAKICNKKRHRTKERKIGQVIDQVGVWRRYYNGYTDYHGKVVKLSLDEAALKVGIPKKSLDDYFLQLRLGKTYGFNFNEHKDENVGVLRAFIKKKRRDNETIKNPLLS